MGPRAESAGPRPAAQGLRVDTGSCRGVEDQRPVAPHRLTAGYAGGAAMSGWELSPQGRCAGWAPGSGV